MKGTNIALQLSSARSGSNIGFYLFEWNLKAHFLLPGSSLSAPWLCQCSLYLAVVLAHTYNHEASAHEHYAKCQKQAHCEARKVPHAFFDAWGVQDVESSDGSREADSEHTTEQAHTHTHKILLASPTHHIHIERIIKKVTFLLLTTIIYTSMKTLVIGGLDVINVDHLL